MTSSVRTECVLGEVVGLDIVMSICLKRRCILTEWTEGRAVEIACELELSAACGTRCIFDAGVESSGVEQLRSERWPCKTCRLDVSAGSIGERASSILRAGCGCTARQREGGGLHRGRRRA